MNANNNTYWCIRTLNSTHNSLYCEFITGFVTYYDMRIDPYQLRNIAHTLSEDELAFFHRTLQRMRVCKGSFLSGGFLIAIGLISSVLIDYPQGADCFISTHPPAPVLGHDERQLQDSFVHDGGFQRRLVWCPINTVHPE